MRVDPDRVTDTFENVEVLAETHLALLCVIEGDDYWIPRSQIREGTEIGSKHEIGRLVVSHWIAVEKGLIDDNP